MNRLDPLKLLSSRRPLPPLPEDVLFGVASSDHQCEAYDPQCEDIRDIWERQRGQTPRGRATDFQARYEEDIQRARGLGCSAFRFSIAWSRFEPQPGRFDSAVIEHYHRLIHAILSAGMQPILTLHHFTWPVHVEQRGGMIAADFPATFAGYVSEVAMRYGRDVHHWITFNEPSQLVLGYIKPWWEQNYFMPPGLPEGATLEEQVAAVGRLVRNLFLAHSLARAIIKRRNPDAQVGSNPLLLGLPVWLQRLINWNAARQKSEAQWRAQGRRLAAVSQLEKGEVDVVIAALSFTPERDRQVMFSEPYYVASLRLLTLTGRGVPSVSPSGLDLADKTLCAIRSSTAEARLKDLFPRAHPLVVDDYPAALQALDSGRANALLADDTILASLITRYPGKYRIVGQQLARESYAVAVTQGHRELLDAVDLAVRRFKTSGEWQASCARHLDRSWAEMPALTARALSLPGEAGAGEEPGHAAPLGLAAKGSALRRIQERGYLIAAVKEHLPGFSHRDPHTGEYSGLEVDLARAIARLIFGDPQRVHFHVASTQERIPLLRSLVRFLDPLLKTYSILSTVVASDWWNMGMAGLLPEFICPVECVGQLDFVGLDYYWGIPALRLERIRRLMDAALGRFDQAPVWPNVLYDLLRYHAGLFPGLPLMIIENGSVDQADGVDRATYIRRHVRQVQRAVRDGVKVIGYVCWSNTSNREWGLPFGPGSDFGLHHIDLDSDPELARVPTSSAAAYREIIANRGVPTGE
jgi:beta-glucosidase/6-phospho-beta-glucosidase/beta-galactosidase/ABC-type amino acid transport substrate-binding protein